MEATQDKARNAHARLPPPALRREDNFADLGLRSIMNFGIPDVYRAGPRSAGFSVFMLVGGIVIMNIMLQVSAERTRELEVAARSAPKETPSLPVHDRLGFWRRQSGCSASWLRFGFGCTDSARSPRTGRNATNAVIISAGEYTLWDLTFGIVSRDARAKLDPIEASAGDGRAAIAASPRRNLRSVGTPCGLTTASAADGIWSCPRR